MYDFLLSLEMITVVDVLKWNGQCPKLIHTLAMSMSLLMHLSYHMICLMWLHDSLSGPEADELLHLPMALTSSSFENGAHILTSLSEISSKS